MFTTSMYLGRLLYATNAILLKDLWTFLGLQSQVAHLSQADASIELSYRPYWFDLTSTDRIDPAESPHPATGITVIL